MMKNFTLSASRRLFAAFALFVCYFSSAIAGSSKFYSYYTVLSGYPTGAGKVYAEAPYSATVPEEVDDVPVDFTTPAETVDIIFSVKGLNETSYTGHAIPNEGWIVAGFCKGLPINDGADFEIDDSIYVYGNPASLYVTSDQSTENETDINYPLAPQSCYYALFTHVAANVAMGQDSLGTVKVSKLCNDIGDVVTLTATPSKNYGTTTFAYWTNKATGEQIKENPLTITVSDTARYEAFFQSDQAVYMDFPEYGGYKFLYNEKSLSVPQNVEVHSFDYNVENGDTLSYDRNSGKVSQTPMVSGFQTYNAEPLIVYGKGQATFIQQKEDNINSSSTNMLRWTGDKSVAIKDQPLENAYYSIDLDKTQFHLLSNDAIVEAKTVYLALPKEDYTRLGLESAPEIIYWKNPSKTGIVNVVADSTRKNVRKGIYTLDGQKLKSITKNGLYIVNGKKVIYLKK